MYSDLGDTMKKLGLLSILVLSLALVVMAQDDRGNVNDPTVNERANACYAGGTLAGKCTSEWDWIAGWYLIRFEYGLISREAFPEAYRSILPALDPSVPDVDEPVTTPEPF